MPLNKILTYLVSWSLIGSLVFSLFVIFLFRSGVVFTARDQDGSLKRKIPIKGLLIMVAFLLSIVAFLVLANYYGLVRQAVPVSFGKLFALNMALYIILFLYDTLFIDGFVIGYWRPNFLQLPDAMGWESMKEHMIKSIPVGTLFGLFFSALSSLITYYGLIR